ncbi:hypothetical protein [Amycolatopsis taiwanensis]|uniref:Uncharacterized protein n=1 Tax=Amycolatopsis taiwanensis TaxID=342230 RepID=A0A9W6QZI1_9PSEU|nr:hypothetical protein [Amycolatopsis taiwanensis]GLY64810.1 hypothetical protein Atai01_14290 [Amycolatopsis taiwanensis]
MNAGQYPPPQPRPPRPMAAQPAAQPTIPHPGVPAPPPARPEQGVLGARPMPPVPARTQPQQAPPQQVSAQQAPPQQVSAQQALPQQVSAQQAQQGSAREALGRSGLAVGIPAPLPPGPPAPSGPSGPSGGQRHVVREQREWRTRRHRSIPRLRIGAHYASERALNLLQVSASSFGIGLGRDSNGVPIAVSLFRPEPVTVDLVGGAWAARLLAYRALRSGARLMVFSDQWAYWVQFGQSVTGRSDRVAVLAPDADAGVTASADAPVLCLHDTAPAPGQPQPWQTRLQLHRRVAPERVAAVRDADMLLMQRLTPNEAGLIAPVLGLPPQTVGQLQTLRDDMMALITQGGNRYVWLDQVPAEVHWLGRPGRY